jgi:hypothetical protein
VSGIPEIRPGQSIELLKELHILTRDGRLNQDSRRKLKQVYHLCQFIEPLLSEVRAEAGELTLVDHGAGKSYLGFILYDLYLKGNKIKSGRKNYSEVVGLLVSWREKTQIDHLRNSIINQRKDAQ